MTILISLFTFKWFSALAVKGNFPIYSPRYNLLMVDNWYNYTLQLEKQYLILL